MKAAQLSVDNISWSPKPKSSNLLFSTTFELDAGNILGIPSLAQTVAATVPQVVTGLAGMIGGVYGSATGNDTPGAASFWNAASAAFPIFGALESAESPKGDGMVHSPAGYRRFGDAVRSHWGTDIALEYYVND